jgi:hypothetical protein
VESTAVFCCFVDILKRRVVGVRRPAAAVIGISEATLWARRRFSIQSSRQRICNEDGDGDGSAARGGSDGIAATFLFKRSWRGLRVHFPSCDALLPLLVDNFTTDITRLSLRKENNAAANMSTPKCGVCHTAESKYKCPVCALR